MQGPVIQTERLILRPPKAEDFDAWAAMMADEETARFIGGAQSRPVVWRSMCVMAGGWALYGFAMFSVIEKSSGRWIGRLGPWQPEAWPGTEIGWGLVREAHGKGYATEGASAAIEWAFDHLGWTDVIHCIDEQNLPSQKVAQRLGSRYRHDTQMPPPFETHRVQIWGQTKEEWRARWQKMTAIAASP